jgi:inhibitor of growth protein 5/inhibitor of growth protein 4
VDRHCKRLDNDLQRFEDEQLIGPGRIVTKKRQLDDSMDSNKKGTQKER